MTAQGWLPSKLFEYIACNRPILANTVNGEAARLIRTTKSGYVVISDEYDEIAEIFERLYMMKRENGGWIPWDNDHAEVEKLKQHNLIPHLIGILDKAMKRRGLG